VDHHTLARISIAGTCLDVVGSLYLAYDLLGGQHGPLRLLTRMVTYSIIFGIGYGLGLGAFFGVVAGLATGFTLAIEMTRASRGRKHFSLWAETAFGGIRATAFGVGLYPVVGFEFALGFAVLVTIGTAFTYSRGLRPATDYEASRRMRITRRQFWGTVSRAIGYIVTALVCSALTGQIRNEWPLAIRIGLVTGLVTGLFATVTPYIEYYADNLPERRMGAFGIALIFCGFVLQSVQYWLALLDVKLT
jgi:hypothetical protein